MCVGMCNDKYVNLARRHVAQVIKTHCIAPAHLNGSGAGPPNQTFAFFCQMFTSLKADEQAWLKTLWNNKVSLVAEVKKMKAMLEMIGGAAGGKGGDWHQGKGAWEEGGKGGNGRVVLDEKYFRRCEKCDGIPAKFKSWTAPGNCYLLMRRKLT